MAVGAKVIHVFKSELSNKIQSRPACICHLNNWNKMKKQFDSRSISTPK